ncbi:MAG: toprim domain-containing protein [Candidatus Nanoarchaeia archaeon]|nr:toprim domain-containing protein [Candidatus Nanoarchaeia archaeon]MDD5499887.1 toprim domain-containing protein [Candidatus Nanoarchaeia archaeon]
MKGSKPLTKEEFIQEIIRSNKTAIVEGKKDVAKLKKLGISNVISLSRMPLSAFCEEFSQNHDEVILLMDNDAEGKKLYSTLKTEFSRLGVKSNPKYQKNLAKLKVSHVEGL